MGPEALHSALQAYAATVLAVGTMGALLLVQILIADVVGIKRRHVPGSPVAGGHEDLLFRVSRTVANSNESIAVFLCAVLFCVGAGASPAYTAYAAWGYVGARAAYALCYYLNAQTPRSLVFALSLLALLTLLVLGFVAAL